MGIIELLIIRKKHQLSDEADVFCIFQSYKFLEWEVYTEIEVGV